jgi:hypothetical protein
MENRTTLSNQENPLARFYNPRASLHRHCGAPDQQPLADEARQLLLLIADQIRHEFEINLISPIQQSVADAVLKDNLQMARAFSQWVRDDRERLEQILTWLEGTEALEIVQNRLSRSYEKRRRQAPAGDIVGDPVPIDASVPISDREHVWHSMREAAKTEIIRELLADILEPTHRGRGRRPNAQITTRDARIREIKRSNPGLSHSELLKLVRADAEIQHLAVNLTLEVVRNAIKPPKMRRKQSI